MALSPRLIRRRIKSVANTRKITKAMELVAASKMRKSVQLALASRSYSKSAKEIVDDVRVFVDPSTHPLLAGRKTSKSALVIVAASDRGLCGGFNAQLLKKSMEFLRGRGEKDLKIVTVGKRAEAAVRRAGFPIIGAFEAISNAPSFERSRPVGDFAYKEFMAGRVDRVFMVYTDYRSAISVVPTVVQLLPIVPEDDIKDTIARTVDEDEEETFDEPDILFEPDPRSILDALLPRLLETRIYQGLLESSASEHSARMLAMRSATDNASDMLQDLTLTFNQARQAGITREISEISAGKAAIE
ncbi:MAG: ATP synthase F1 subunit gamma [Patescibacteria group bacterium]|jgi:F-type H+-transporting ATPase subunit gamma